MPFGADTTEAHIDEVFKKLDKEDTSYISAERMTDVLRTLKLADAEHHLVLASIQHYRQKDGRVPLVVFYDAVMEQYSRTH
ncbi:hypothetical protein THASP1DRAFT_33121 [Thamnocephalis sphaerospora]|uniref:EF-hand domain-containing protein n=1 Tax=Thamnocephalis sphaerospora TaxID=78915 RepID=A0A4V1IVS2_9FUNG|nr:hypothetical protein THASP1DRAFT_33121 [Thamnocephalis sphaerospora]|eukprot:RKP05049.1 hypothetical protein THASP1DRAFT_33121 [Thamnocephalis sphaerospora]